MRAGAVLNRGVGAAGHTGAMTRLEAILKHLKEMGAQQVGLSRPHSEISNLQILNAGDRVASSGDRVAQFTEYSFRWSDGTRVPILVRDWNGHNIDILFIQQELCAGSNKSPFDRIPEMDWVLRMIDIDSLRKKSEGEVGGESPHEMTGTR
jgi:hypothetical protein